MIAALLLIVAAAPQEAPVRFAVVVGHNASPAEGRPPLSFADDDAARFYLQQAEESERAWLLTTFDAASARAFPDLAAVARQPTREDLMRVLGEAAWHVRARRDEGKATELVFYFAGHGDVTPAGEGYVVFADGPFTRSELATHVVRGSPADVNHVVVDACASYFMVAARGPGDEATSGARPLSPQLLDALASDRSAADDAAWARTGILVSTSDAAAVHESDEIGAGVFSHLLRSALAGAADVNGDGRVEYAEAAAFVAQASARLPDPRARVDVHARAPAQRPNASLADLSRGAQARYLALDTRADAHVRILDSRGQLFAELHRAGDERVYVRLVREPFFVVQIADREAVLVPRDAGAYALSSLRFEKSPRRRAVVGGPFASLFAEPFDASFVAGFVAESTLAPPVGDGSFAVSYAPLGTPPFSFPYGAVATGAFVGAGALGAVAVGAAIGNLVAFAELERQYRESASFDDGTAFAVEAWRTGATVSAIGAVAFALTGGGLLWVGSLDEEDR